MEMYKRKRNCRNLLWCGRFLCLPSENIVKETTRTEDKIPEEKVDKGKK